ncbi:MAG TPA: DNA polymerase III subunit beta [Pseudonocardiaceae bacterium]|jgi:DNA polymerase-3 subunit beta|nr:DNA polymerase III subunit beta [Pseudonocardiaceae bacterium]
MQLTIDRDQFTTALAWVARALPTQVIDPVLNGILIEADTTGQVHLSAYDRDTSASTTTHADVATAGRALVSGTLLATIAKLLPTKPVTLSLAGTEVTLACGAALFTLPTLPIGDYPALPGLPPYCGEVNAAEFAAALRQVVPAASTDATLMNTYGVLIEIGPDQPLRIVGTDRFRLALRCLPWQPTSQIDAATNAEIDADQPATVQVRVDARQLEAIAKQMATAGGTIRLSTTADAALLGLSDGTRRATLAAVATPYPDYRHFLAQEPGFTASVPVAALSEAIKRAAVFTERGPQNRGAQIRLRFTATELEVTAGFHDTGRGQETLPIQFDGDDLEMAFNPGYLLDALGATRTRHAQILVREPHKAALVHPLTTAGQPDQQYQHLVMPIRLPGEAA